MVFRKSLNEKNICYKKLLNTKLLNTMLWILVYYFFMDFINY